MRELTYLLEEKKQAWAGDMIELLTRQPLGQSQLR